jgi:hypothetical protein
VKILLIKKSLIETVPVHINGVGTVMSGHVDFTKSQNVVELLLGVGGGRERRTAKCVPYMYVGAPQSHCIIPPHLQEMKREVLSVPARKVT